MLAWEKVDTEAKPKVPASLADSTAGAKGAAGATGKQLGAGMAGTAGGTSGTPTLNNQEGGGPNERFRNASILSVENTPILMDELKEIMRVGNLQYVLAYMTYYDDTAHKVKLSNANEDDFETLMEQGGVVLPHMKNCQDWDAFLADRRKWTTRSHLIMAVPRIKSRFYNIAFKQYPAPVQVGRATLKASRSKLSPES